MCRDKPVFVYTTVWDCLQINYLFLNRFLLTTHRLQKKKKKRKRVFIVFVSWKAHSLIFSFEESHRRGVSHRRVHMKMKTWTQDKRKSDISSSMLSRISATKEELGYLTKHNGGNHNVCKLEKQTKSPFFPLWFVDCIRFLTIFSSHPLRSDCTLSKHISTTSLLTSKCLNTFVKFCLRSEWIQTEWFRRPE